MLALLTAMVASSHLNADGPTDTDANASPAADVRTGTVEGVVTYRPDAKRPWRYARYYIKNRDQGQLAEAVVALAMPDDMRRNVTDEPAVAVIDQQNFQFIPETVAIRAGDRVKFINSDNEVHSVQAAHSLHQFNVNMPAGGEHVETFARAGGLRRPYRIGCAYHSAMRAWIFVFDHPHFQVTDTDGRFRLADVAPGNYTLEMVHPAGTLRWKQTIDVKPGQTTKVAIVVSPLDQVKIGANR